VALLIIASPKMINTTVVPSRTQSKLRQSLRAIRLLPLAPCTNKRDISRQATLSIALCEVYLHILFIYLDVFRDDRNQLILQRLQQLGGQVHPVLDQYQL
jgi:hypothetical protein